MAEISVFGLIQAGLVWSTTLAWSDVVKSGAEYVYPNNKEKLFQMQILYAVMLTIIIILIIYFLQKTKSRIENVTKILNQKINEFNNLVKLQSYSKSSSKLSSLSS